MTRLLPPYPGPGPLGPTTELWLEIGAGREAEAMAHALRQRGCQVRLGGLGDLTVGGRLGALEGVARSLSSAAALGRAAATLSRTLGHLSRPPPPLRLGRTSWRFGRRTYLLGVVNVTPDSFSGDGVGDSPEAALERAQSLVAEGADALDVGGESTRPGHQPVPAADELKRVVPAVRLISSRLQVPVFVDTSKAEVARAALAAGAVGINDVWGLARDPEMARVASGSGAALICMHNQRGTEYRDLLAEVQDQLTAAVDRASQAGLPPSQVVLDPGIGFGKGPRQNFEVLRRLAELRVLGHAILVGTSRKSLVAAALGERPVGDRLLGTAATVAWAIAAGADVVRVHDVAEMRDVARVTDVLARRAALRPGSRR